VCGIVGYIGQEIDIDLGLSTLKRLEYRGYDSAGLAIYTSEGIKCIKTVGKISQLEGRISTQKLFGSPMILHTRWATHGAITENNAHPFHDCCKNIYLVHNGIIENYMELKSGLLNEGHHFTSETDTEVLCHLIEKYFSGNLEDSVREALRYVKGAYAICVISKKDPQKIVAACLSSPLTIGINDNGYLIASDTNAVLPYTHKIVNLDDYETALITNRGFSVFKEKLPTEVDFTPEDINVGTYPNYMLKEIFEQPTSLENTLRGRTDPHTCRIKLGGIESVSERLFNTDRLALIACGTAYHACLIGKYMFEAYTDIPVEVDFGSEYKYRRHILHKNNTAVFVSQSGETSDVIASLKDVKSSGVLTLGMVNNVGTTIARKVDAGVYLHAGLEVGVAATKTFTSQLVALLLLALFLNNKPLDESVIRELNDIPKLAKRVLNTDGQMKTLADKYKNYNSMYYIGRRYSYPIALEGALKAKEVAYIHAEGLCAGELKHGDLSLVGEGLPTVAIVPRDSVYEKTLSNIEEIKTRHGTVIAVATEGDERVAGLVDDVIYIPSVREEITPILSVIPLQLFAYYLGIARNCDVDKPRNLAKSVTVE